MTSVSVVIPSYNHGRFLERTLASITAQTVPVTEIIVVDDGSKDDTPAIMAELQSVWPSTAPSLRYCRTVNQGVSVARNTGVAISTGEWIAFLDADDLWHPTKIERQLALADADPSVGAVQCGFDSVDENLVHRATHPAPDTLSFDDAVALRPTFSGLSSTLLVRTDVFAAVGGFDRKLSTSADFDLGLRLLKACRFASIPDPLISYFIHSGGMHMNVKLFEHDMVLAMAKATADMDRGRARTLQQGLDVTVVKSFGAVGDWKNAARVAAQAVRRNPAVAISLVRQALRRDGSNKDSLGPRRG